jgi:F-type H+-transporting ATPase subunit delta
MLKGAIARRYAAAIFDIARKQNTIDRTLEDIEGIAQVFANRKLSFLLREPKVPAKRKETAIRQALASKVLPTSLNLALLVVQRDLVEIMPGIARELKQMVMDYKNEAIAEVTTAARMDEAELALIKQALEKNTGKTIIMQTRVQPAILGGVIARVGDEVVDGSVRYRLSALQHQLLNNVAMAQVDFFDESRLDEMKSAASPAQTQTQTPPEQQAETSKIQ